MDDDCGYPYFRNPPFTTEKKHLARCIRAGDDVVKSEKSVFNEFLQFIHFFRGKDYFLDPFHGLMDTYGYLWDTSEMSGMINGEKPQGFSRMRCRATEHKFYSV